MVITPSRLRRLPRALLASTAIAAAAVVGAAGLSPVAAAETPSYVALGDSYSSGTGTGVYAPEGGSCLRSPLAYPALIAGASSLTLNFRACSGAEISDVQTAQLGALSGDTDVVTISVGGNDAGFADVLTTCALPWWLGRCSRAVSGARSYIDNTLPGSLERLYDEIAAKAPGAEVTVVGYPRLFNGRDCNALTFFSGREMRWLNETADLMNRRLREQATSADFAFADPTSRFVGHAVCDRTPWLNNLTLPAVVESFHPNRSGHAEGYTPVVAAQLPTAVTARRAPARRVTAREIARSQEQYAALDATIEPKVVGVPDLTTRRAERAARRHGINLERWVARQTR